jgi:hypothetical protein
MSEDNQNDDVVFDTTEEDEAIIKSRQKELEFYGYAESVVYRSPQAEFNFAAKLVHEEAHDLGMDLTVIRPPSGPYKNFVVIGARTTEDAEAFRAEVATRKSALQNGPS